MSFVVEGSVPNMDSKNMLNYCIKTKAHETFVHLREYKVRCQQCNQPFVTNFALKEHIRAVHDKSKKSIIVPFVAQILTAQRCTLQKELPK